MEQFNAKGAKMAVVAWIRDWFEKNGAGCKAIVGISGGKDSSVVAALCAEALGKDRVIGVLMPQGNQRDIDAAMDLVEHLNIESHMVNIGTIVREYLTQLRVAKQITNKQCETNIPPRVRMAMLYAFAAMHNGRVANTSNYSEDFIGYTTKFGDSAGDFAPIMDFTMTEVKAIGHELGLPRHLVEKVPEDGLTGKTDEENFGFKYADLDAALRDSAPLSDRMIELHEANLHKVSPIARYEYILHSPY